MPVVVFVKDFAFSPNGYDVITYTAGAESVEVSDECARVAIDAGYASRADADRSEGEPEPVEKKPARRTRKRKS